MGDYPNSYSEFSSRFSTEESCREYLINLRWPEGFVCPKCENNKSWKASRNRIVCSSCRYHASITAGTIFQGDRKPLKTWFYAIWYAVYEYPFVNAIRFQKRLGLGSYVTAWSWMYKIRRAMAHSEREKLSGEIEVDTIYYWVKKESVKADNNVKNIMVAIAVEKLRQDEIGRIRMACIPENSFEGVVEFIKKVIKTGSVVYTGDSKYFHELSVNGYAHFVTNNRDVNSGLLPYVSEIAYWLDESLTKTYRGRIRLDHLAHYLDEGTFRFNNRDIRSHGLLFYRLLKSAVQVGSLPYKNIVGETSGNMQNS